MKIICTRQNKDGSFDEAAGDNKFVALDYTTSNGFIRYGIPTRFYGHKLKIDIYYGESIYKDPDKTIYYIA